MWMLCLQTELYYHQHRELLLLIKCEVVNVEGSGKSTVCRLFGKEGFEIIDCDEIVHGLYRSPVYCAKIAEIFGKHCVKDGAVDRSALSAIVFSDSEKLALLNTIASSFIKKAILQEVDRVRAENVNAVLDAPLLFEYELHHVERSS